jgi:pyruvate dehydrogenase E1 component alpha subunit
MTPSRCEPRSRTRSLPVAAVEDRVWSRRTYRLGDHTTADDASRYRSATEVQLHWKQESIARLRSYLVAQHVWGRAEKEALAAECQQRIDAAVDRYLAVPARPPETMFDHLYARLPNVYASQRDQLKGGSRA